MASEKVTQLLAELSEGNRGVVDELTPFVYHELKRLAGAQLRHERPGHTLQATALVHEAYLKLIDQRKANWQNRAHFFGVACQIMRRILLDYAKSSQREKRGGGAHKTSLDEALVVSEDRASDLVQMALVQIGRQRKFRPCRCIDPVPLSLTPPARPARCPASLRGVRPTSLF